MTRTTILESMHSIADRRPQLVGCTRTREGDYMVLSAACGCENRTYIVAGRGPSADGHTDLCDSHAISSEIE